MSFSLPKKLGQIVPVLRFVSSIEAELIFELLIEAKFRTIELTLTTPNAFDLLKKFRSIADENVMIGAGTVCTLEQARHSLDSGADYLVSPFVNTIMIDETNKRGKYSIVGAFTPTEIYAAHSQGAHMVKLFPANAGGPSFLKAIRAVFGEIDICPTGGIDLHNYRDYLNAGASCVGIGSSLLGGIKVIELNRQKMLQHLRQFSSI